MGASCSSTAFTRYSLIKRRLNERSCLTFEVADGLVSRVDGVDAAPPIWLFGEDHGLNESETLPKSERNCAMVLDLIKHAVSDCESNAADVVFIYENAVISDNPFFHERDPNDVKLIGRPRFDTRTIRDTTRTLAKIYPNVRPVYMDVFGRMRLYFRSNRPTMSDLNYIQATVFVELEEFWVTSGRYDAKKANEESASHIVRALSDVDTGMHRRIHAVSAKYSFPAFKLFMAILCAKTAQSVIRDSLQLSYSRVYRELDEAIERVFDAEYDILPAMQRGLDSGQLTRSEVMFMMFESAAFAVLSLAGDAVLYEYITTLPSDKLVVMHAGYFHTNNQRAWLTKGKYDTDVERLSRLATGYEDFVASRR